MAVQSDGKVLVGGSFNNVQGQPRIGLARLNIDGTLDTTFNPGANGSVEQIVVRSDDKMLIGGGFTLLNQLSRNRIARLNAAGTADTTFDPGTGPNNTIYTLGIQADGKIVVGGSFTSVAGTARNRVARLNADGSFDSSFNPGSGASSQVSSLAIDRASIAIIGGWFTTVNGVSRNRIARLNGE